MFTSFSLLLYPPPPSFFLFFWFCFFSPLVSTLHHCISCCVFPRMMQGRVSCQRLAADVMLWKYYRVLSWINTGLCAARLPGSCRVLQGLAGLNGANREALADSSSGRTAVTILSSLIRGRCMGLCFQLDEIVTARRRAICACVCVVCS